MFSLGKRIFGGIFIFHINVSESEVVGRADAT
jgi:hypothetical protein